MENTLEARPNPSDPSPVMPPLPPARPWGGFLLDMLLSVVIVIAATIVGMMVWGVMQGIRVASSGELPAGGDSKALAHAIGEPGGVTMLLVGSLSMLAAAVIIYFWRRRATPTERVQSRQAASQVRTWVEAIGLGIGLFAFSSGLMWLLERIGNVPEPTNMKMLQEALAFSPWLLLGVAVLLAPLSEELLFRRVFYGRFQDAGKPLTGMWVTGALFALMHEIPGTTASPWPMALVLLAFYWLMGMSLAWIYRRSGTLLSPVLTHATNNLLACIMLIATT